MSRVKDKLHIILITYNRAKHVNDTFNDILNADSPIKDYDILVLDNNSTDNTYDIVKTWQEKYPNISYMKNKYNLGISGNIARAMELADKEYVWIIADDDSYNFDNWSEVETAIENQEKVICISNYAIPKGEEDNYAHLLCQMVFISAIILKTSALNDTVMRNVVDTAYTLMPHLCPLIDMVNKKEKIYVLKQPIVIYGAKAENTSYIRGCNNLELFPKTRLMSWHLGYANILQGLKDKKLAQQCFALSVRKFFKTMYDFSRAVFSFYSVRLNYLCDILVMLPVKERLQFFLCIPLIVLKKPRTLFNMFGWFLKEKE